MNALMSTMSVTAYLLVADLGSGLYEDWGQCLMELIRNGVVASMPHPGRIWEPKRACIEIFLINHPLANNKPALVVLDHGCGLTDPAIDGYCNWIGTSISQLRAHATGSHTGASQKGIGRLAALALNKGCLDGDPIERIKHGYYLLSRTAREGDVRFIPVIPERIELERGFNLNRHIASDATEMGHLKNLRGSFTAIVIPTPVFKTTEEIKEAIKWLLPREHDKMFSITVNGEALVPPPLERDVNVSSADGAFRAYISKTDEPNGGIWLCDADTGLRVANCQRIGGVLPEPLQSPELIGDIFAPGLLRNQNTARSTLNKEFFRKESTDWQRLKMFLIRDVVPKAKKLVERDSITGDAAKTLDELATMFNDRFGPPAKIVIKRKSVTKSGGKSAKGDTSSDADADDDEEEEAESEEECAPKYRRTISIKVRDEVYHLYRGISFGPYVLAEVDQFKAFTINVNVRGSYKAMPSIKAERREHFLLQILLAIGRSKFPSDQSRAIQYANEVRSEFLLPKK